MAQQQPSPPPLLYQRLYNGNTNQPICGWHATHYRPAPNVSSGPVVVPLLLGGVITIHPNLIGPSQRHAITNEILQYRDAVPSNDDSIKSCNNSSNSSSSRSSTDATSSTTGSDDVNSDDTHTDVHTDTGSACSHLSLFRQYQIRCSNEPRLNCLLHTHTHTYNQSPDLAVSSTMQLPQPLPQPGYYYRSVKMMARSYDRLPLTYQLTKEMELLYTTTGNIPPNSSTGTNTDTAGKEAIFNIGANIVLYRDAHDSMGFHADNDQGESYILATILSQKHVRQIIVKPNQANSMECDVQYMLELYEGDAYSMDGTMQQLYVHSVPRDTHGMRVLDRWQERQANITYNDNYRRLVIIFRRGEYKECNKDSGRPICHETLWQTTYHIRKKQEVLTFGDIPNQLMEMEIYTRKQLEDIGAHRMQQRGISGNQQDGCNAIIVSGHCHQSLSYDTYYDLTYCATGQEGGLALLTSYANSFPIRVFRSSKYASIYRANDGKRGNILCDRCYWTATSVKRRTRSNVQSTHNLQGMCRRCVLAVSKQCSQSNVYRYDGLYDIINVETTVVAKADTTVYIFEMKKVEK